MHSSRAPLRSPGGLPGGADLLAERLVFVSDVLALMAAARGVRPGPRPSGAPGRRPHAATVHRWILRGVGGVHLEAVKLGGRWATSVEAVDRFIDRLTHAATAPAPQLRPPAAARRAARLAAEAAEAEGL
jgi:hypothetical protein